MFVQLSIYFMWQREDKNEFDKITTKLIRILLKVKNDRYSRDTLQQLPYRNFSIHKIVYFFSLEKRCLSLVPSVLYLCKLFDVEIGDRDRINGFPFLVMLLATVVWIQHDAYKYSCPFFTYSKRKRSRICVNDIVKKKKCFALKCAYTNFFFVIEIEKKL